MVPAVLTVLLAVVTVGLIFVVRTPIFIIGILSLILLIVTIYFHISLYQTEYRSMTLAEGVKSLAPMLLIGAVIVMSIGYILMLRKGNARGDIVSSNSYGKYNAYGKDVSQFKNSTRALPPEEVYRRQEYPVNRNPAQRSNYASALDRLI
jgi:hypothetical protein